MKVKDKIRVIRNLLKKVDTLIIGGGMAYTFIKAQGGSIGKSLVDDEKLDYCKEMLAKAEKLGKKIRDAQTQKVPYMIVIGEKERESGTVAPRERAKGDLGSMSLEQFRKVLDEEFNPLKQ